MRRPHAYWMRSHAWGAHRTLELGPLGRGVGRLPALAFDLGRLCITLPLPRRRHVDYTLEVGQWRRTIASLQRASQRDRP